VEKRPLGRPRHRWEDKFNNKNIIRDIGYDGVD
jgi:hypothetical protein